MERMVFTITSTSTEKVLQNVARFVTQVGKLPESMNSEQNFGILRLEKVNGCFMR